ncbi:MAG TPA: recombination protein RecR [candidate division Zixibacteria bacterium]|nr:recombination protein RecR [candidate division Zixibacteria bacterium]
MQYGSPALSRTIDELMKLPGIGRKTAQRLAFHLLKSQPDEARALAQAIIELKDRVRFCRECFNATEQEVCGLCRDPKRDPAMICVVEEANDLLAVERTAEYRGLFHVLQGHLSPLDGIGPDDIRVRELMERLGRAPVREVIVATNPNAEGEATAVYLTKLIKPLGIRVTRIARGLPVGSDLEFSDEVTLARALEGRLEL